MPTLEPTRDQNVELLIKATSEKEARKIASDLAGYSLNATITEHSTGYFVIEDIFSLAELNGDFYSKVKSSDNIAILSDSSQKLRRDIVLEEAEKVENCLRKLLLRTNDFIEDYYNLFLRPYTKDHAEKQTAITAQSIDPITSLLTFDTMVVILGTDISWSQHPINAPKDILKLIDGVDDIKALRDKLNDKLKTKLVWDVISKSVLVKQYDWKDVAGMINKVKTLRNRAAHFQVLTDKDVKDAKKWSKTILAQIGMTNQKKQKQISYVDLPDIAGWLQGSIGAQAMEIAQAVSQSALDSIGAHASELAKALNESTFANIQAAQSAAIKQVEQSAKLITEAQKSILAQIDFSKIEPPSIEPPQNLMDNN